MKPHTCSIRNFVSHITTWTSLESLPWAPFSVRAACCSNSIPLNPEHLLAMFSSGEISTLVEQVNAAAQAYSSPISDASLTFQSTATSRHPLLAAAKALVTSLEDPEEEAWRFLLQPCAHACLISAWQCGILDQWPKDVMTAKELAVKANADERLVGKRSFHNVALLLSSCNDVVIATNLT